MKCMVRILLHFYSDIYCRMGNKAWTLELSWTGKKDFNSAGDHAWTYQDSSSNIVNGGMVRSALARRGGGSLTFLQVYAAGHMVPMDQPQAALALLNTFIQNRPFY